MTSHHSGSKIATMNTEKEQKEYDRFTDPNYIAYKKQEEELKQNHLGKWVAFSDGQLAVIAENKELLFKLAQEKGITGFLCHQIVEKEKIYQLKSPRISGI